ncbi:MAG: ABC transporter transmembrane domain-containing protein, partial [Thiohalocapsa sp.]
MSAIPADVVPAGATPSSSTAAGGHHQIEGPLGALLPHLLHEMGWQRSDRVLKSAVPDQGPLTLAGFMQALRRLGLEVTVAETVPERWDTGIDAALVRVARDGDAEARVRRSGVSTRVLPEGPTDADTPSVTPRHYVLVVDTSDAAVRQPDPTVAWTPNLRRVTRRAFVLSFFINLLALSVPIFSMQIYDRVIGGNAPEVLPWFVLGTVIAIGFMLVLRRQRSRLLAGAYARMGYHLSLAVMDRMLRLPLLVAGKLRRSGLTSRAREIERVRGRLAAANTVAVFDAPFIVLSLAAVVFVGGWLVLIPVVYLALFALVARWMTGYVAAGSRLAAPAIAEREAMLTDLAEHGPALLGTRAAEGWTRRFLEVSANAVRGGYVQGTRQGFAQATAYVLGTGAALATLVGGLELVLAGAMTPGGLIASMLLIWRITAPAQALFLAEGRLRQADAARAQVERFFASPYEGSDATKRMPALLERPSLIFERV